MIRIYKSKYLINTINTVCSVIFFLSPPIICSAKPWLPVPSKYSIACNLPALNPYNGLMLCNAVISSHDISTVSKYTQYTIACHSVAWGCAKAQLLRRVQGYGIKNEYLSIMLTLPNKKLLPPGIFTVTLQCPKIQAHDAG